MTDTQADEPTGRIPNVPVPVIALGALLLGVVILAYTVLGGAYYVNVTSTAAAPIESIQSGGGAGGSIWIDVYLTPKHNVHNVFLLHDGTIESQETTQGVATKVSFMASSGERYRIVLLDASGDRIGDATVTTHHDWPWEGSVSR